MNNTMNVKQRAGYEDALRAAFNNADRALDAKREVAREAALAALAKKYNAVDLVKTVRTFQQDLEATEKQLGELGFELVRGELRLSYDLDRDDLLHQELDELISAATSAERKKVDLIRKAQQNAWSVDTLTDATKVLAAVQ